MLKILIVEDEPELAATLRYLVELNPRYKVTATAHDLESAMRAADEHPADLALVDLQLANSTSGFSVAARLHERGVLCLFTTGQVPSFPLPDLALGCLAKPFGEAELVFALTQAEDVLRGRQKIRLRNRCPDKLQLYSTQPQPEPLHPGSTSVAPRPTSLAAKVRRWRSAVQH